MDTEEAFADALERVRALPDQPPNALLEMYSLYKQATEGDVKGSRPGALDFRGRAKYDAWAQKKGMTREAAMKAYVAYADSLGA